MQYPNSHIKVVDIPFILFYGYEKKGTRIVSLSCPSRHIVNLQVNVRVSGESKVLRPVF